MKIWKMSVLGYFGGALYCGLELLWRGWTHGSMFLVGGLCFLLLGAFPRRRKLWKNALLGAACVSGIELVSGILLNRVWKLHVWDYSAMPLNLWGQICLPYCLLWIPVCAAGLWVYQHIAPHIPSVPKRKAAETSYPFFEPRHLQTPTQG